MRGDIKVNIKRVFSIINHLRGEWYKPPSGYYNIKKPKFKQKSYARSALNEIYLYLIEHENDDPIDTLENFRSMMDNFSCKAKNIEARFMFSVYYDVASDVLDVLLSEVK